MHDALHLARCMQPCVKSGGLRTRSFVAVILGTFVIITCEVQIYFKQVAILQVARSPVQYRAQVSTVVYVCGMVQYWL